MSAVSKRPLSVTNECEPRVPGCGPILKTTPGDVAPWMNGIFLQRLQNSAPTISFAPNADRPTITKSPGSFAASAPSCPATPTNATAPNLPKRNPTWCGATINLPARTCAAASRSKLSAYRPWHFSTIEAAPPPGAPDLESEDPTHPHHHPKPTERYV